MPESTTPSVPESTPSVPESTLYVPESTLFVPETTSSMPESTPSVPESTPSGYSSRLLKKPDQCRAAYLCSHLFWTEAVKDSENVLLCLKRALKIANKAQEVASAASTGGESVSIGLFVEVHNKYLYFFNAANQVQPAPPPRAPRMRASLPPTLKLILLALPATINCNTLFVRVFPVPITARAHATPRRPAPRISPASKCFENNSHWHSPKRTYEGKVGLLSLYTNAEAGHVDLRCHWYQSVSKYITIWTAASSSPPPLGLSGRVRAMPTEGSLLMVRDQG